jgi:hypothetical protein|eukprot:COSAG02_NODE_421_length_22605_cov_158.841198_20_plen_184_part_00
MPSSGQGVDLDDPRLSKCTEVRHHRAERISLPSTCGERRCRRRRPNGVWSGWVRGNIGGMPGLHPNDLLGERFRLGRDLVWQHPDPGDLCRNRVSCVRSVRASRVQGSVERRQAGDGSANHLPSDECVRAQGHLHSRAPCEGVKRHHGCTDRCRRRHGGSCPCHALSSHRRRLLVMNNERSRR